MVYLVIERRCVWMIDTNCSDKYKALRKNLLDAILITREEWDEYQNLREENDKFESLAARIDELQDAINKVGEIIQDFYDYDYEDENWARLDTICKINRVVKDLVNNDE